MEEAKRATRLRRWELTMAAAEVETATARAKATQSIEIGRRWKERRRRAQEAAAAAGDGGREDAVAEWTRAAREALASVGRYGAQRRMPAPVAECEDVPVDRRSAFGNMFIMRDDGSDREGVCDAYEEVLRCTRCDEGAGLADQVRGMGNEARDAVVRHALQGIANRHGVWLDERHGGYRAWRGLVRAIDAQVELEREGRRRRYVCHCWPERCHGQGIATEVAWRAKAHGGEWRRRRAERGGGASARRNGARVTWAAAGAQVHEYEVDAEAGRDGGRVRSAAKRPRPVSKPSTPQTLERLGDAGPQIEGPSMALPASLADGHDGGGDSGGGGGGAEAAAFLREMSEEMAADRASMPPPPPPPPPAGDEQRRGRRGGAHPRRGKQPPSQERRAVRSKAWREAQAAEGQRATHGGGGSEG